MEDQVITGVVEQDLFAGALVIFNHPDGIRHMIFVNSDFTDSKTKAGEEFKTVAGRLLHRPTVFLLLVSLLM